MSPLLLLLVSLPAASSFQYLPPSRPRPCQMKMSAAKSRVIVIGAGVGGLCVAGRLAKSGLDVTIVEKNPEDAVGGRLNELRLGPYRFETGPSLMLLPNVYEETFRALGVDMGSVAEIKKVEPSYLCVFDDNTSCELWTDHRKMEDSLEKIEPGSFEKYVRYLSIASANLKFGLPNLIEERLELGGLPGFFKNVLNMDGAFPLRPHYDHLASLFATEKLRALASFQDLYVGLTPYEAPSVFSLLQAIEVCDGVFYPIGGFHGLARGLQSAVERLGVKVRFESQVEEILVQEGSTTGGGAVARGVRLVGGESLPCDVVVSNVDAPFTSKYLLPPAHSSRQDHDARPFSTSVVSIHWALKRRVEALRHHSVFLHASRESWDSVFARNEFNPNAFNFYVHAPSNTDPSACPPGCDAITILVPCPLLGKDETGAEPSAREREAQLVQTVREAVLRRFERLPGMGDFRGWIVDESITAPSQWRAGYGLSRGSVFGLRHNLAQLSLLRPPFANTRVKHLYHVGASNRPGNGVPLVMIGSRILAERLCAEYAAAG